MIYVVQVKHFTIIHEIHQSPENATHTWWRHQMETFSALLAICAGNSPVTGEFPSQRPVTRSFDVFFENGWVNNREAGDMGRHHAHYDVIVIKKPAMWRLDALLVVS